MFFHQERLNYYFQVYIDEDNLEEFPQKLKSCMGNSLALSCEIMGIKNFQFMSTILQSFPKFTQLKIYCSFKQLKDSGLIEITKAVKSMTNLTVLRLHLCNNTITDKGMNELSKAIRLLDKLQHLELNLSQNKIEGGSCFRNLAQSLEKKQNLVEINLDISSNCLSKKTNIKPVWNIFASDSVQIININCSQNKISEQLLQQIIYIFSVINGQSKYSIDINISKRQKITKKQCLELSEQLRSNKFKSQHFNMNFDLLEFTDSKSFISLIYQLVEFRFWVVQYSVIFSQDQQDRIIQGTRLFSEYLQSFKRQLYIIIVYNKLISNNLIFCKYQHLYDLYS